ncbi:MAG: hypothetical protein WCP17_00450 [bacterium]
MKRIKRALIIVIAVISILLGLIGLVLPILQGILFLFIGFFLLSFSFPETRTLIEKYTQKYPHLHSATIKIEKWIKKIFGEI